MLSAVCLTHLMVYHAVLSEGVGGVPLTSRVVAIKWLIPRHIE
jgi:hypothetical protein